MVDIEPLYIVSLYQLSLHIVINMLYTDARSICMTEKIEYSGNHLSMKKKYYVIEKRIGQTPLQAIDELRAREEIPTEIPMAYAGRLDPMAHGRLLILLGDECKKQRSYHGLDKQYEFEILFDIKTDTGDILGLPFVSDTGTHLSETVLPLTLAQVPAHLTLPYPVYSSKTVRGKPLFLWTLENRLHEVDVPEAHTRIHALTLRRTSTISARDMLPVILERINSLPAVVAESKKLGADFRRSEIRAAWAHELGKIPDRQFYIAHLSAIVSSGTYIRSLAPYIASLLGASGMAYSIHRTTMGRYIPFGRNRGMWWKKY